MSAMGSKSAVNLFIRDTSSLVLYHNYNTSVGKCQENGENKKSGDAKLTTSPLAFYSVMPKCRILYSSTVDSPALQEYALTVFTSFPFLPPPKKLPTTAVPM